CDGKELFIAVISETPPGGKILQRVTPQPESGDARTWMDDSIELVLDPLHTDATSGRRRLYHANINARGAINDTAFVPGGSRAAIRNPRAEAIEVRSEFQCVPKSSAPAKEARALKIAPGAVEVVEFSPSGLSGEEVYASIRVASSDGAAVYYLRDFQWKLGGR